MQIYFCGRLLTANDLSAEQQATIPPAREFRRVAGLTGPPFRSSAAIAARQRSRHRRAQPAATATERPTGSDQLRPDRWASWRCGWSDGRRTGCHSTHARDCARPRRRGTPGDAAAAPEVPGRLFQMFRNHQQCPGEDLVDLGLDHPKSQVATQSGRHPTGRRTQR